LEQEQKQDICAVLKNSATLLVVEPPVIFIPLADKTEYPITKAQLMNGKLFTLPSMCCKHYVTY
jgi:hypothetical protein